MDVRGKKLDTRNDKSTQKLECKRFARLTYGKMKYSGVVKNADVSKFHSSFKSDSMIVIIR